MSKISIEEALKTKLPLPWKVTDQTGTRFLVARRRPEDLTNDLFEQLETYGVTRTMMRELFYILPKDWSGTTKRLGISPGKHGGARRGAGKPAGSANKQKQNSRNESALKTTPPAELPRVPVDPPFRMHDVATMVLTPEQVSAAVQFADMTRPIAPAEGDDGLNYQDRHNLGIDDAASNMADETGTPVLEFFDSPNGCGARQIIIPDPPANSAKLQITCHDYSLGQLKNILASLPSGTTISGTIHIAL